MSSSSSLEDVCDVQSHETDQKRNMVDVESPIETQTDSEFSDSSGSDEMTENARRNSSPLEESFNVILYEEIRQREKGKENLILSIMASTLVSLSLFVITVLCSLFDVLVLCSSLLCIVSAFAAGSSLYVVSSNGFSAIIRFLLIITCMISSVVTIVLFPCLTFSVPLCVISFPLLAWKNLYSVVLCCVSFSFFIELTRSTKDAIFSVIRLVVFGVYFLVDISVKIILMTLIAFANFIFFLLQVLVFLLYIEACSTFLLGLLVGAILLFSLDEVVPKVAVLSGILLLIAFFISLVIAGLIATFVAVFAFASSVCGCVVCIGSEFYVILVEVLFQSVIIQMIVGTILTVRGFHECLNVKKKKKESDDEKLDESSADLTDSTDSGVEGVEFDETDENDVQKVIPVTVLSFEMSLEGRIQPVNCYEAEKGKETSSSEDKSEFSSTETESDE